MAIVILSPQNCLGNGRRHQGLVLSPLKSRPNSSPSSSSSSSNPNFNHEDATCSGSGRRRRKRTPTNRPANRGRNRVGESSTAKNLVMGQVKILKRGEMLSSDGGVGGCMRRLDSKAEDLDLDLDLVLGSTDRFGPDPHLMPNQAVLTELKVANGTYAGSGAFFASPPPCLVPLPLFLDKNGTATLRRLLRLDLV